MSDEFHFVSSTTRKESIDGNQKTVTEKSKTTMTFEYKEYKDKKERDFYIRMDRKIGRKQKYTAMEYGISQPRVAQIQNVEMISPITFIN